MWSAPPWLSNETSQAMSVYFISEVLSESKLHYPQVQKLLYMILITSRKLRHYF